MVLLPAFQDLSLSLAFPQDECFLCQSEGYLPSQQEHSLQASRGSAVSSQVTVPRQMYHLGETNPVGLDLGIRHSTSYRTGSSYQTDLQGPGLDVRPSPPGTRCWYGPSLVLASDPSPRDLALPSDPPPGTWSWQCGIRPSPRTWPCHQTLLQGPGLRNVASDPPLGTWPCHQTLSQGPGFAIRPSPRDLTLPSD